MRLLISYYLITIAISSCGQNDKKTTGKNPNSFHAIIPKKPMGWVSDYESVFRPNEIAFLDSIIGNHKKLTTNEIAVATLRLDTFEIKTPEDFDQLSLELFREWGVGEKDKNNGLGVLLSTSLRKIRIEVGYGLETKLTDEEAKNIIDTIIIPDFKKGDYFTGISKGLQAIFKEIQ